MVRIGAHRGEGAGRGPRQPPLGEARRDRRRGAGEPLFRIIVDGAIDLEADAPEQSLARFAIGMPATLRLPGVADPVAGPGAADLRRKSTRRAAPARCASRSPTCRTPTSAPSPPARSSSCAATASARRPPRCGATATRRASMSCATGGSRSGASRPASSRATRSRSRTALAEGESVVARAAAFLRPGDRVRPTPETTAAGG